MTTMHVAKPLGCTAWALAALLWLGACGSPGRDIAVDVGRAPTRPPRLLMGEEVGRLLSPDPTVSQAAERRLMALDEEGRDQLVEYAATLEGERDVRLLNVLDEHHALPPMSVDDTLDFLLWKATRPQRFFVMKAQSRLLDLTRREPDAVIERLRRDAAGAFAVLAVVLAGSGTHRAIPVLLERYRRTEVRAEREAAAAALAQLTGGAVTPRASGPASEIAWDADAVDAWYQDHLEQVAPDAPPPAEPSSGGVR